MSSSTSHKTHFGFETIDKAEKTGRVRGVFDSVASNYDIMNDVMSGGLHRIWKRQFVGGLALQPGMRILDLAGGTGDISFLMRDKATVDITVCDINAEMLLQGKDRAIDKNIVDLNWLCGNAECLPCASNQFDRVTMAFGIRNVTDIPAALRDIYRTIKPGGSVNFLEFSHVTNPALAKIYEGYSFHVIPRFGQLVAKDKDSYQYLVESIRQFPKQEVFADMIREAGFERVTYRNVNSGVVAIHSGVKI